jgi:hypothetical protein
MYYIHNADSGTESTLKNSFWSIHSWFPLQNKVSWFLSIEYTASAIVFKFIKSKYLMASWNYYTGPAIPETLTLKYAQLQFHLLFSVDTQSDLSFWVKKVTKISEPGTTLNTFHKQTLHHLCISPNVRAINSRSMRYVARTGKREIQAKFWNINRKEETS